MTLRAMRWWDIEPIVEIERELFGDTAWSAGQFWSELAQPNRTYVVHDDDRGIAGYAGLMRVSPTADIQTIAVAPRAQRRGVASDMLTHLLQIADATCSQTFLEVSADNDAAITLYERSGFAAIARRTSYYGPGLDALIMRRDHRGSGV